MLMLSMPVLRRRARRGIRRWLRGHRDDLLVGAGVILGAALAWWCF